MAPAFFSVVQACKTGSVRFEQRSDYYESWRYFVQRGLRRRSSCEL